MINLRGRTEPEENFQLSRIILLKSCGKIRCYQNDLEKCKHCIRRESTIAALDDQDNFKGKNEYFSFRR